ncbi:ribonuclease D [Hyphomicrobiales bacterium]|mgnify:FL=1|jgi:ribonuclease D|nr:ribonuclease D [Hyphomicrobiales bacterium]|tara:strand:+ start:611 stop:1762 length:1152 start_codon:yes stop_codon:yes gene_type:complete
MELIKTNKELKEACKKLNKAKFITIDTEFIREKTYWSQLCLIQVCSGESEFIIDPLEEDIDLKPFIKLLNKKSILKVFHSGRQDIEIFFKISGKIPSPIFDTQIAAMVCGFGDSVGYEKLVDKLLRKKIDKSSRFSNWAKRPLTNKQLNYAIGDVTHLFEIYPILNDALKEKKRTRWLDEELKILTSENTYNTDPELAYKRLKIRGYDLKTRGVTFQLAKWREERAQNNNLPRGRVIRDDIIYELSSMKPKSINEIMGLRSFSNGLRLKENVINEIQEQILIGLSLKEENLPKLPEKRKLPHGTNSRVSLLKILLNSISEENEVAQKLIASTQDLEDLIADDSADIKTLKGWRYDLFGKKALDFKNGKVAITMEENNVILKYI